MLSVPYEGYHGKTAIQTIEHIMQKKGSWSKTHRPFSVHRLDKETSGVMMFALSQEMQQQIMNTWHKMILERTYVAVAENPKYKSDYFKQKSGIINDKIAYNKHHIGYIPKEDAKNESVVARTNYKILKEGKVYSFFELNLDTGRKNQIRVHLSGNKYPLAGDENYRAKTNPFGRLALHAKTLVFIHPVTKQKMTFEVPEDESWLKTVETYNQNIFEHKEHHKKISDEDIDVKFSTKKQLSKMDFIQRGKFQKKK